MASTSSTVTDQMEIVRVLIPQEFFTFADPLETKDNSMYQCLLCPPVLKKTLSFHNRSRPNLKKHESNVHPSQVAKFDRECD